VDEEDIQRAQGGDQAAFGRIVECHARLVWRTAAALLHDDALAEDAAQEAWLDAWRALGTFHPDRPLRPWLLMVVGNRCRMLARRRTLTTLSIDREGFDILTDFADAQDVEGQTIQAESQAELRAILATLSSDQRAILELHFFADLALSEIALVIDTPLGTVKSRLHRALETLRGRMQPQHTLSTPQEDPR
jgi:RNA polymerase sigma factor (sigma-70 family)